MKRIQPSFRAKNFSCPHCDVLSSQNWYPLLDRSKASAQDVAGAWTSICLNCSGRTFWLNEQLLHPIISEADAPHVDLPCEVLADFEEARAIAARSPRGACALLRLCIQKLCIHLGEPGKNLNDDIGSLVRKGLSPEIQRALDIVRVVGNNAVHPGEMAVTDNREIAYFIFQLVNRIVNDRITLARQTNELFDSLSEGVRTQIDKRDSDPNA